MTCSPGSVLATAAARRWSGSVMEYAHPSKPNCPRAVERCGRSCSSGTANNSSMTAGSPSLYEPSTCAEGELSSCSRAMSRKARSSDREGRSREETFPEEERDAVVDLVHHARHLDQPRALGGTLAPLAGEDLVAAIPLRADHDRLRPGVGRGAGLRFLPRLPRHAACGVGRTWAALSWSPCAWVTPRHRAGPARTSPLRSCPPGPGLFASGACGSRERAHSARGTARRGQDGRRPPARVDDP